MILKDSVQDIYSLTDKDIQIDDHPSFKRECSNLIDLL